MDTSPQLVGQRYVLQRQIGRGGMGAVWLAVDAVLGREVAVKRVGYFPDGGFPDLLRAQREAKLAARLNDPHVVAVLDLVSEGDQQWLVMEYVEGADLAVLAQPDGLLPEEAAGLLAQVAKALAAAHGAGIVHRDVKPSNVLVTAEGVAKLADFGIARARDSTLTATSAGVVTGSPAYLAPEVASGRRATEASDVWSLGATLYHALTGRPPYEASDNVLATMYRIVHEDPPRLNGAGWPAGLLEHTLVTEPAQRWPMSRVVDYLTSGPSATKPSAPATSAPIAVGSTAGSAEDSAAWSRKPHEQGRGSWAVPVAAGVVVLLIAALAAWGLWRPDAAPTADEDRGRGSSSHSSPSPSQDGTRNASASPSPTGSGQPPASPSVTSSPTAAPTTDPTGPTISPTTPATDNTPSAGGPGGGRPAAMRSFVQQYVATALADPATAWRELSPRFQQDCCEGSLGNYAGYWNTIAAASLRDVHADPESMQVSYVITWDPEGERPPEDEQVTLGLVEQDGRYLIDYEL